VKWRAHYWEKRKKQSPRLSVQFKSSPAICSTSWTMRCRKLGSGIRMNALVSARHDKGKKYAYIARL